MNLEFTKKQDRWVSEIEVTADFNLHIEGVLGTVSVFQRTTSSGQYAYVKGAKSSPLSTVYDMDFTALVYPKYIKVVSGSEVVEGVVTFGA